MSGRESRKSEEVNGPAVLALAENVCIFNDYNGGQVPASEYCPENLLKFAREVVRLNKWADGMSDTVLKERAAADANIKELRERLEKAFGEITRLTSALSERQPIGLFWQTVGEPGKWYFSPGSTDPWDIHDNGKPIHVAYLGERVRRGER